MIVHEDRGFIINYERPYFICDSKKYGFFFKDDEGREVVICHRRGPEIFRREYGFYVPVWFFRKGVKILFEIKNQKKAEYTHYIVEPRKKNRLLLTQPQVFVGLAGCELHRQATHIKKPKCS